MLKKGPFSKRYWFLSELGKHAAKNDLKAPSASVRQMPSLLLTVRSVELSFLPKWCPWDNSAFCSWVTQWSRWVHPRVLPLLGVLCPSDTLCLGCLPHAAAAQEWHLLWVLPTWNWQRFFPWREIILVGFLSLSPHASSQGRRFTIWLHGQALYYLVGQMEHIALRLLYNI